MFIPPFDDSHLISRLHSLVCEIILGHLSMSGDIIRNFQAQINRNMIPEFQKIGIPQNLYMQILRTLENQVKETF